MVLFGSRQASTSGTCATSWSLLELSVLGQFKLVLPRREHRECGAVLTGDLDLEHPISPLLNDDTDCSWWRALTTEPFADNPHLVVELQLASLRARRSRRQKPAGDT